MSEETPTTYAFKSIEMNVNFVLQQDGIFATLRNWKGGQQDSFVPYEQFSLGHHRILSRDSSFTVSLVLFVASILFAFGISYETWSSLVPESVQNVAYVVPFACVVAIVFSSRRVEIFQFTNRYGVALLNVTCDRRQRQKCEPFVAELQKRIEAAQEK